MDDDLWERVREDLLSHSVVYEERHWDRGVPHATLRPDGTFEQHRPFDISASGKDTWLLPGYSSEEELIADLSEEEAGTMCYGHARGLHRSPQRKCPLCFDAYAERYREFQANRILMESRRLKKNEYYEEPSKTWNQNSARFTYDPNYATYSNNTTATFRLD